MATQKFTTYICDTCRRTIDIDNDPSHSQIDIVKKSNDDRFIDVSQINKCIITLGCEGRLYPVEQKNVRNIARSESVSGIEDWTKRSNTTSTTSTSTISEEIFIPLNSNNENHIVLAIKNGVNVNGTMKVFIRQDKPITFVEYRYDVETVPVYNISGKDTYSKNLRFLSSDHITLKFNGVEMIETVEWNRKSLMNNGIYDAIEFINPLITTGIVKILVSKESPTIEHFIPFSKQTGTGISNAWSNIEKINIGIDTYTLYVMDITSVLPINSFFSLTDDAFDNGAIAIEDCYFLLSSSPWSVKDRNYETAVNCADLISKNPNIKYYQQQDKKILEINSSTVSDILPPIYFDLTTNVFEQEKEFEIPTESLAGTSDVITSTNTKIIGIF